MENTMKRTKIKKIFAVLGAATIMLGASTSIMSASALTQSYNRDLNGTIDDIFDWCNPQYQSNPAKAKVRIWMDKSMTATSRVKIYEKVGSKVNCVVDQTTNHTTTSSSGSWTDSGWKKAGTVKVANSLTLIGKRNYSNGTNMEYNTSYYNNN